MRHYVIVKRKYLSLLFILKKKNGDLETKIKEKNFESAKFEKNLILKWSSEMISGVDFLHKNGIIHYDIEAKYLTSFLT